MIRVGILGFGFMGKMHFNCYKANKNALIVAICDADKQKIESGEGTTGNINGAEQAVDLSGLELYTDFDKILKEANLDALSITLPTFLHKEFTIKALEAGVNVLCEKPIAINLSECEAMISAAQNSGKVLQIGHCVRFWPEYAKTKQLVASGQYGKVLAASFRRLSAPPVWSWQGWLLKESSSGGAIFDLHKAAIVFDCTRQPAFKVCPIDGEPFEPEVESGDGYSLEIAHFLKKIKGQNIPEIITPQESLASVKLVLAEKKSAESGKEIVIE